MPHWPPCIYAMDWIIHTTQNPLTHSVIKTGRAWLQEWLSSRWKKFLDSKWDLLPLLLWTLKLSLPRRRVKIPIITTISELQNASASVSNFCSNNNPFAMQAPWQAANLPEKAGNSRLTSGTLHSHVAWEKRKIKRSRETVGVFPMITHSFCFSSYSPTFNETWRNFGWIGSFHTWIVQDQAHPTSGKQDLAFHTGSMQDWASCVSSAWDSGPLQFNQQTSFTL